MQSLPREHCWHLADFSSGSSSHPLGDLAGVTGATGTLLFRTLEELRSLAERTLPQIRLAYASGSVTPP